mmetsp:Transcript_16131/g.48630  ORF Transcript_16131/g.48630 Transcript_16131/m.48630 type:complete len:202 (-) Transcript_16131:195-800(-)
MTSSPSPCAVSLRPMHSLPGVPSLHGAVHQAPGPVLLLSGDVLRPVAVTVVSAFSGIFHSLLRRRCHRGWRWRILTPGTKLGVEPSPDEVLVFPVLYPQVVEQLAVQHLVCTVLNLTALVPVPAAAWALDGHVCVGDLMQSIKVLLDDAQVASQPTLRIDLQEPPLERAPPRLLLSWPISGASRQVCWATPRQGRDDMRRH